MKLVDYQRLSRKTAIYPKKFKVIYPAMGLAGEAGEILNKVKKVLRGDKKSFSEIRADLVQEIGDLAWYVANLATDLGLDLDKIAACNLAKLRDRKRRGVLKGSGDHR